MLRHFRLSGTRYLDRLDKMLYKVRTRPKPKQNKGIKKLSTNNKNITFKRSPLNKSKRKQFTA